MFPVTPTYSVRKAILYGITLGFLYSLVYVKGSFAVTSAASSIEPSTASSIEPSAASSIEPSTASSIEPSAASSIEPSAASSIEPSAGNGINTTAETSTSNTTEPNTTSISVTTEPTTAGSICSSNPCKGNARCVELIRNYTCECEFGLYYDDDKSCKKGQTFGGELTILITFDESMKDTKSEIFAELRSNITSFFERTFAHIQGYQTTLILDVRKGSVITTVTHTFTSNATVSDELIKRVVADATQGDSYYSYVAKPGCQEKKCDKGTTAHCFQPPWGILVDCICKVGFYKLNPSATTCKDSCQFACNGMNQYFVRQDNGECKCKCDAGYKLNNRECESCPFGFSGEDCNDGFKLSTLVIGIVAGVLSLSLSIGLIYACTRLKRVENVECEQLLEQPMAKIPRVGRNRAMIGNSPYSGNWPESNGYANKGYENHAMERRY
ncbi:mucin-13-like [Mustelus asterias]